MKSQSFQTITEPDGHSDRRSRQPVYATRHNELSARQKEQTVSQNELVDTKTDSVDYQTDFLHTWGDRLENHLDNHTLTEY